MLKQKENIIYHKTHYPEPNDIDKIYQVLKQANQISNKSNDRIAAAATCANATTTSNTLTNTGGLPSSSSNNQQQEIPILNIPECPERVIQRRGQLKPHTTTTSQNVHTKHTLAAPLQDISSSSGLVVNIINSWQFLTHNFFFYFYFVSIQEPFFNKKRLLYNPHISTINTQGIEIL